MKQKKVDNFKKIFSLLFLLFWCLLIFYFSNQKGDISKNSSNGVIELLNQFLRIFSDSVDLNNIEGISFIIRKSAHMFLYFVLYIAIFSVFKSFNFLKNIKSYFLIFGLCFLYAISDEVHQLFITERSFGIIDILIDTFGSSLGFFFLSFGNKKIKSQDKRMKS